MESLKLGNREIKDSAIIIQARMSSVRFPGKMLNFLTSVPLIEYIYRRCQQSCAEKILIATSIDSSDDILYQYCMNNNILVMRGSLDNVLERYIQAGELIGAKYIVRVCGDTPFVDISLIDILLQMLIEEHLDYVSMNRFTCAAGFYSETVTLEALKKVAKVTKAKEDLEHVTKYIIENKKTFLTKFIDVDLNPESLRNIRLTMDSPEDIEKANNIVSRLRNVFSFNSQEIIATVSKI